MIAAIYARKSTDQSGVSDDQKSVARQIDHARAYAARKGWTTSDDLVFVDDGISGAEFANRPGFLRLMNALKPKPPFQVLVMSEESRLGREAIETAYALKQLVQAGVRVFFYMEDRERTLDSPTDKIMMSLTAFADELEREKGRQRTSDAMVRKAKAGHVCGGRCFGYDNVPVDGHVARVVNEAEAEVIRRIFALCAAGTGFTRIAKQLNADRAVAPRPQQDRPAGWSPSTVREVLHRELYRGVIVWNQTRKRDRWGRTAPSVRPVEDWITVPAPALRIVSDEAWEAAHARLRGIRLRLAVAQGSRPGIRRDVDSKYLLSGFARCGTCGGTLSVVSRPHGRRRVPFYACLAHHKRGEAVCANGLVMPLAVVDAAVLEALAGDVLRPAVVEAIIAAVFDAMAPDAVTANVAELRAELRRLDVKIGRLTTAIEEGAAVAALVSQLQSRQTEREGLLAQLAAAEAVSQLVVDRREIQRKVMAQVSAWRGLLTEHVEDGRQLLREVLEGPLRFTAEGQVYRFEGEVATGRLVAGLCAPWVASPGGAGSSRHRLSSRHSCRKERHHRRKSNSSRPLERIKWRSSRKTASVSTTPTTMTSGIERWSVRPASNIGTASAVQTFHTELAVPNPGNGPLVQFRTPVFTPHLLASEPAGNWITSEARAVCPETFCSYSTPAAGKTQQMLIVGWSEPFQQVSNPNVERIGERL